LIEVLGEAAVAAEPRQCALDHPSAREDDEAFGSIRTPDDRDSLFVDLAQCVVEFVASIAAMQKHDAAMGSC